MKPKVGDKVSFLNEVGGGKVLSINGNRLKIYDDDGFEWEVGMNEVVLDRKLPYALNREIEVKDLPDYKKSAADAFEFQLRSGRKPYPEIDLHIHEITSSNTHLTNFEIVRLQLNHFQSFMAMVKEAKFQKVVFIHGVGEGVLRTEIRALLDKMPNCTYRDADFNLYGRGATEVNLWYN